MPAKKGNRNAVKHGVHGYLAIGSLPKGASYIRRQLGEFRRQLEDAVREKNGDISIYSAALIQSACRHEGRAQLLTRWLRQFDQKQKQDQPEDEPGQAKDRVSLTDRLAILKEIGNASDARDKCLQKLGLDSESEKDPLSFLDSVAAPAEDK